jgi:hypothetical protein
MFTLETESFAFELKEGTVKHVGASTAAATAKLYEVTAAESRAFGDERVKLAFEDGEGNEVEVALFPEEAAELRAGLAELVGDQEPTAEDSRAESGSEPGGADEEPTQRGSDWLE